MSSKKITVYTRVSTSDQNADMQLDGLRDLVAERDWAWAAR